MTTFLLFESASGYALFECTSLDEIGATADAVQQSVTDVARFGKAIKLAAFKPFTSAANALEQINAISESQVHAGACMPSSRAAHAQSHAPRASAAPPGRPARGPTPEPHPTASAALARPQLTDDLKNFLTTNLPKVKKDGKAKFRLGVAEPKLGSAIQEETNVPCECNELMGELLRGVRQHFNTCVRSMPPRGGAARARAAAQRKEGRRSAAAAACEPSWKEPGYSMRRPACWPPYSALQVGRRAALHICPAVTAYLTPPPPNPLRPCAQLCQGPGRARRAQSEPGPGPLLLAGQGEV